MAPYWTQLAYLVAAVLFILGLKALTHPRSARRGNLLAATGMAIAIIVTALDSGIERYGLVVAGVIIGGIIGAIIARRVEMAAMPQLVALLHSFVGLVAVLVAIGTRLTQGEAIARVLLFETGVGAFIGAITFTGSLVAFGKLQALIPGRPLLFPGRHAVNLGLVAAMLLSAIYFVVNDQMAALLLSIAFAMALGVLLITPIGGVDMPVIISMLNSYSGWAAAATGFTLGNSLLIITGALVGFSGAILSYIMCRAMNRSFLNVLVGGFGRDGGAAREAAEGERPVRTAAVEDMAFMLANAGKVIIVPGYGMAVAQAQHALNEMLLELERQKVEVKFAIHPVAGRMPGHMNVLLAEADVPYENVVEMEEINPEFAGCDVALVIGANDVTNPAARTQPDSPTYGMPILDVYKARHIFFVKRSMRPGYAGIDNELFYQDNCALVFGDAKKVCEELASRLREEG